MQNISTRVFISDTGLRYKDITQHMGITPEYLSRLMRYPLSASNAERIESAVKELLRQRGDGNGETSV